MVFLRMASVIVLLITLLNTLKKKDKSTYLKAQVIFNKLIEGLNYETRYLGRTSNVLKTFDK